MKLKQEVCNPIGNSNLNSILDPKLICVTVFFPLLGEADVSDRILQQLEDGQLQQEVRPGVVVPLEDPGEYDSEAMKAQVLANVHSAFRKQEQTVRRQFY